VYRAKPVLDFLQSDHKVGQVISFTPISQTEDNRQDFAVFQFPVMRRRSRWSSSTDSPDSIPGAAAEWFWFGGLNPELNGKIADLSPPPVKLALPGSPSVSSLTAI